MSIISSIFGQRTIVENLDYAAFAEGINSDPLAVLLDTRTKAEFNDGHIPNSVLIDFMSPKFKDDISKLDTSKSYYVYCRSGNRSYHACKLMKQIGFEKVFNLADGIIGWEGKIVK